MPAAILLQAGEFGGDLPLRPDGPERRKARLRLAELPTGQFEPRGHRRPAARDRAAIGGHKAESRQEREGEEEAKQRSAQGLLFFVR